MKISRNFKLQATTDDLVIKIASPSVAAAKLGLAVKEVIARREELGLPKAMTRRQRLAKRKAK